MINKPFSLFARLIPMATIAGLLYGCQPKSTEVLKIYSRNGKYGDSLFFETYDIKNGKELEVKFLTGLDIVDITQKQNFLIVNNFKGTETESEAIVYENGVRSNKVQVDVPVTEFQLSSTYNDDFLVLDETDLISSEEVSYVNSFLLYSKKKGKAFKILVNDSGLHFDADLRNTSYMYYPRFDPIAPSAERWQVYIQIFDLKNSEIITIDTIQQSNFNERDGYWNFHGKYSFWLSETEVTFLCSTIYEDKTRVRIQSYQIALKKLSALREFDIPNDDYTEIDFKYVIKDDRVFISYGGTIYQIDEGGNPKIVYKSANRTIVGFHF